MDEKIQVPTKFPPQWAVESPVPVGWMKQFRYFLRLYEEVKNVSGDFVECGVGQGNTFCMLAYLVGSEKVGRTLWGFDSFEGWPEPTEFDHSPRNPKKGEWNVEQEETWKRLKFSKILKEYPNLDLRVVPGFFEGTLPNFPDRKIAFLHIDADLYPSYRDALHYLFPKVSKRGVVCFDEYREIRYHDIHPGGVEKWPGATKAIDDYFRNRPEKIQYYQETDKYYVIKEGD